MPYLVRKINKRDILNKLEVVQDMKEVSADMPTTEFRTTDCTLSTWIVDSLENIKEAVLAIAVTSSKVSKMDFIVIDTELLVENDLKYDQTDPGQKIAVPSLQNTHYDIQEITLKKLENCCIVYKKVLLNDNKEGKYIVRYTEGEIRDLMKDAVKKGRVDISLARGKIKDEFSSIFALEKNEEYSPV